MKIFVTREAICGSGIQVFEGERNTTWANQPNCVEVRHSRGSISYYNLGEDAFLTHEEALDRARLDLVQHIQSLEGELAQVQTALSKARDFLNQL